MCLEISQIWGRALMPCRGVSLPEMGCPAMDLLCFFVEKKKFFFQSANFSYQAIEIEIGFTFETTKLRGWISCMAADFLFPRKRSGHARSGKKKFWVLSGGPRKEFGSAFPPFKFSRSFFWFCVGDEMLRVS